ncbi:hypothetical protein P153DRAFT_250358, partial [Dothidotthia symphoricarpi CBS 119687]
TSDDQFLCLTICGYRRPGMSQEEYRHHMTHVSGPMTKGLMVKYGVKSWSLIHNTSQTRAIMTQLFDEHMVNLADFDCFSQVVFRSVDDYKRMREDPWYKEKVAGDHKNFADTHKSMMTIGWITDFVKDGELISSSKERTDAERKSHASQNAGLDTRSITRAKATALITGAFLSGCMMSLSLMAVPVMLDTTTEAPQLFLQWTRMYHYGHQVLPTLAICTFLLYSYVSFNRYNVGNPKSWFVYALAGAVTLSLIPFTWIFMVPTNDELFRLEALTRTGARTGNGTLTVMQAKGLVIKWSWLHFTRSCLPLVGALIG